MMDCKMKQSQHWLDKHTIHFLFQLLKIDYVKHDRSENHFSPSTNEIIFFPICYFKILMVDKSEQQFRNSRKSELMNWMGGNWPITDLKNEFFLTSSFLVYTISAVVWKVSLCIHIIYIMSIKRVIKLLIWKTRNNKILLYCCKNAFCFLNEDPTGPILN